MTAKFDVDEKVFATGKILEINTTDEGTVYQVKVKTVNGSVVLNIEEDELEKKNTDSNGIDNTADAPSPTVDDGDGTVNS